VDTNQFLANLRHAAYQLDYRAGADDPNARAFEKSVREGNLEHAWAIATDRRWFDTSPFRALTSQYVVHRRRGDRNAAHAALVAARDYASSALARRMLLVNSADYEIAYGSLERAVVLARKALESDAHCSLAWVNLLCALGVMNDSATIAATLAEMSAKHRWDDDPIILRAFETDPQLALARSIARSRTAMTDLVFGDGREGDEITSTFLRVPRHR
jgi:hypothetical protein